MSVPLRDPVFVTVKVASTVPFLDTFGVADRFVVVNVVYESPNPKG
jgi:hypothetical protein